MKHACCRLQLRFGILSNLYRYKKQKESVSGISDCLLLKMQKVSLCQVSVYNSIHRLILTLCVSSAQAMGHLQRKIAHRVVMSELPAGEEGSNAGRFFKCHRWDPAQYKLIWESKP